MLGSRSLLLAVTALLAFDFAEARSSFRLRQNPYRYDDIGSGSRQRVFDPISVTTASSQLPGPTAAPPPRLSNKQDFYVDGAKLPGISDAVGNLGPSYAGSIYLNATSVNTLFFWLWPQKAGEPKDSENLVIWFNGGPGCSSLVGLFSENGPFSINPNQEGLIKPKVNPWSWHRISDIMWVEQPPPTGFATGPVWVHNNVENGEAFRQWFGEFCKVFPEYKDRKITIVGESYGGYYSTYIWDALSRDGGFRMGGIGTVDAVLASAKLREQAPVWPFYDANRQELGISDDWGKLVRPAMAEAGLTDEWYAEALSYPPRSHIQMPPGVGEGLLDFLGEFWGEAAYANACFSVYAIQEKCPRYWDPLSHGATVEKNFLEDQPGFKDAIHAPKNQRWIVCSQTDVFLSGDPTPQLGTTPFLENLIHNVTRNGRFVVIHGKMDAIIMYPAVEMGIQNYTWGGMQGFQRKPSTTLVHDGQRQGIVHEERNLTYALIDNCGHECPRYNPPTTFKLVQYLLGKIEYGELVGGE